jgi:hypothetical protein
MAKPMRRGIVLGKDDMPIDRRTVLASGASFRLLGAATRLTRAAGQTAPEKPGSLKPKYNVREGRRYCLKFRTAGDDVHPLHRHRHSFELVRVGGRQPHMDFGFMALCDDG